MGIPSYFSFVIKNHPEILTTLQNLQQSPITRQFHHLFFDANSIIYDAFHNIAKDLPPNVHKENVFFELLSNAVIQKIEYYIQYIQPTNTLFLAFDGIPPPAKIVQQRSRRFKSKHLEQMTTQILSELSSNQPQNTNPEIQTFPWQTSIITPGTPFMDYLSQSLEIHFKKRKQTIQPKVQILSTANHKGEGEHKIFQYLRINPPSPTENIAIYGLDSDLIMLSLLSVPNIYIFREAPAFMSMKIEKAIGKTQSKDYKFQHTSQTHSSPSENKESQESYFLNINLFRNAIQETTPRAYDYVFMCFLLGNDFLPHISCLNLRTNGLHNLLKYYRLVKPTLIHPITKQIQWNEFHKLLIPIAKEERELLIQENTAYQKQPHPKYGQSIHSNPKEQNQYQNTTSKKQTVNKTDIQEYIQSSPCIFSNPVRNYINPTKPHWEKRYRNVFLEADPQRFLKQMAETWDYYLGVNNHLELYITSPPLVTDLVKEVFQPNLLIEPIVKFSFQTTKEYLDYVLSDEPLEYHFGFEKFLWETHCH
jgi:5'-3' exonuclease